MADGAAGRPSLTRRLARLAGDVRSAAALGARRRDRLAVGAVAAAMPVKRRVPGLRERSVPLRVDVAGRPCRVHVRDWSELFVLYDVLVDEQYGGDLPAAPRTIVDLGANIGASALWFRARFPEARVIAVEADPSTFARLRRNVGGVPGIEAVHAAATSRDGPVRFAPADASWASRIAADAPAGAGVDVPGRRLATLLDEHGIERLDLLKVDVEGAEYDVLADAAGLARTDFVVGELHEELMPVGRGELLSLLEGFEVSVAMSGRDLLFRARRRG